MKKTENSGIYKDRNQLFTKNPENCNGIKVYGEKIVRQKQIEYRSWNPYRSKLSAALQNGLKIDIQPGFNVLYLGAATGTTVSHISDILENGFIYAVENSALCVKKLLTVCENRKNIIPIFEDAFHPDRYSTIAPNNVDFVYQDISQRNQAEIFVSNCNFYLKSAGFCMLTVKARSIDISLKPKKVYENVSKELKDNNLDIIDIVDILPYEKDHAVIIAKY